MSGIIPKTSNTHISAGSEEIINDNGHVVIASEPFPVRPSFIRNGTFKSAMNGTEFAPATSGNQSNTYTLDGWFLKQLGGYEVNVARGTTNGLGVPAQYYSVINVKNDGVQNGSKFVIFEQRVSDITQYAGKTLSLGFYCKASAPAKIFVQIVANWDNDDASTLTGSPVSIGTEWERHHLRISVPNYQSDKPVGGGSKMMIRFWLCANGWEGNIGLINKTAKYFYFANIEDGSKTSEPSHNDEIDAVSAYFEKSSLIYPVPNAGKTGASTDLYSRIYFRCKKAVSPLNSQISITTSNMASNSITSAGRDGFCVVGVASSGASAAVVNSFTCNCEPSE